MRDRSIAIIYGGCSSEHDASLSSFSNVVGALSGSAVIVGISLYVDRTGAVRADAAPRARDDRARKELPRIPMHEVAQLLRPYWTLNLLHGQRGEDGTVAGWAHTHGLPGSWGSVLGDAIGMDKPTSSALAAHVMGNDGRVPKTKVVRSIDEVATRGPKGFVGPLVLKPGGSGASIKTYAEPAWSRRCIPLLKDILEISPTALIQERVFGEEYSVGVIDLDGRPTALPAVRIASASEAFYDHRAKHAAGHASKHFEDTATTRRLQRLTERLFTGLNGFGMARTDFIVSADGTPYFLETNTLPGLMSASIYPEMLRRHGLGIADLVMALRRADDRRRAQHLDVEFHYSIEEAH